MLGLTVVAVCVVLLLLVIVIRTYGLTAIEKLFVTPWTARKQRVWKLLSHFGGVESSIMDSNPRVKYILQPAFRGSLRSLTHDERLSASVPQQIISAPDDTWVAAYVLSDIADIPLDGKLEYFKAEATAFVFARKLKSSGPEVSFVNKAYRRRSFLYMPAWKVSQGELTYCEAAFMDTFDMYARREEQIDALALAAPDLLESINACADVSDIYFLDNYVYFILPVWRANERNVAIIFETSKQLVAEANTNLPRVKYTKKKQS